MPWRASRWAGGRGCVLSVSKMGAGQEDYYLGQVAGGGHEYYAERGESPGSWIGGGARDLDLAGVVAADDLRAVLAGLDPASGARLGAANRKVPGFDLTFSAPKSVSLLWALGDDVVAAGVVAAHEAAVAEVVGYLEREAVVCRRGRDGVFHRPRTRQRRRLVTSAHRTICAGPREHHDVPRPNIKRYGCKRNSGAMSCGKIADLSRCRTRLKKVLLAGVFLVQGPFGLSLRTQEPAPSETLGRFRDRPGANGADVSGCRRKDGDADDWAQHEVVSVSGGSPGSNKEDTMGEPLAHRAPTWSGTKAHRCRPWKWTLLRRIRQQRAPATHRSPTPVGGIHRAAR